MEKTSPVSRGESLAVSSVPGLARGLSVLQAFSIARPRLSVGELTAHLDIPRNSVVRIARSLAALGFLDMDSEGRMTLGRSALQLGDSYLQSLAFIAPAKVVLKRLAAECGSSAQLLIHDLNEVVVIAQELPPAGTGACRSTRVGARFALTDENTMGHATKPGVLILTDESSRKRSCVGGVIDTRADIVACNLDVSGEGSHLFSVGIATPVNGNVWRFLEEGAKELNCLLTG